MLVRSEVTKTAVLERGRPFFFVEWLRELEIAFLHDSMIGSVARILTADLDGGRDGM